MRILGGIVRKQGRGAWRMAMGAGLCVCALLAGRDVRAEVGYAMRGDSRPFHQWDSMFNDTPQSEAAKGLLWRVGDLGIRPTLGVWAGHDDNLFLEHDNPSDDNFYTIAPGVVLIYGQAEDNYLTGHYEYEDTRYDDFSTEDYESHLFSLGMQFKARGYTTHLSEQYSETTDTEPESGSRVKRTENTTEGRVERQFSHRTGIEAHGAYDTINYDASDFIDFAEWSGGVDLRHQTWPKTYTLVGVDVGRVDVSNPDFGDAEYIEGAIGLRGEPVDRTTVEARLGYQARTFDDEIDDVNEWVASLGVSRSFWRNSVAGVNVSRRLLPSSQAEGITRVPTSVTPYVQHEILRDLLALSLSGTYEWATYHDPAGEIDRTDEYWYGTAVLDWNVRDVLTLGVGITHEEQESDVEEAQYERNMTFLRALANY